MSKKFKRDIVSNLNKYQSKILFPFFVSCLISVACVVLFFLIDNPLFDSSADFLNIFKGSITGPQIAKFGLGGMAATVFGLLIYYAFNISNKILGAYDRILTDLDEMIIGGKRKRLRVRGGDKMFGELVKRMNVFIEPDEATREKMIDQYLKKRFKLKGSNPKEFFDQKNSA